MCAAYSHHRWIGRYFRRGDMIPAPLRRATTISVAACLAALDLGGQSLRASDLGTTGRPARIAGVTINPTPSPLRHGARDARGDDPLLAQRAPAVTDANDPEVLAVFPLTAPQSVDEDIAKEHGLRLIERSELPSLGFRIVRYRVAKVRLLATVIAALQADRRVSRAQVNVRYTLPEENEHATEVSSAKERPGKDADGALGQPSGERRAAATPTARKRASAEPANVAGAVAAPGADKSQTSRHKGSLASGGQTVLRWPTADEPFVNVGAAKR